jgi:hypothetical protein
MIQLGLNQPQSPQPTEADLRKALFEAARSRNLLNNEDFKWWIEKLEGGLEKHYRKLAWSEEEPHKYHKRRGMIQAIEKGLEELRLRASQVETLEERLKFYDQRTEPVARGA